MESPSSLEQLDQAGRLKHFLTTEGVKRETLTEILDLAESFISVGERRIKKIPLLHGKTVVNLFFEPSTRTRTSFSLAAKPFRGCHQYERDAYVDDQGGVGSRYREDAAGHAYRQVRGARQGIRHSAPDRATCPRRSEHHQRGRRAACPSDPGDARHVHHPPATSPA